MLYNNLKEMIKIITSYSRGHKIYYDQKTWRYLDTNEICDHLRSCAKCNQYPTKEGYDYCLGYINGSTAACCGHGVENQYIIFK